ncbi:MAG: PfkB family carbohydrate kinase [Limisphaerales bacterium]|jgi:fructose-1-phosphate kinase PfkB-like protein
MIDSAELRIQCAQKIEAAIANVANMQAFVGLDGFVDEILHVVDKRESAENYTRMPAIQNLADRLAGAAGKSTNVELVPVVTKLGGNGPIMSNALASFGLKVTYLGVLGYPNLHPVFNDFAKIAEVHSIAEPGHTDALEFEDGKVMVGKHSSLKEMNWANIQERFGRDKFIQKMQDSAFVGFVNWTMLPYMSDVWEALLKEVCPQLSGPRRRIFFDLADPEKRTTDDIHRALDLICQFQKHFDVILGLNEKEANEIGEVLGLGTGAHSPEAIIQLTADIGAKLPIETVVVHPTKYAMAATGGQVDAVKGLYTAKPKITTGAGDHFNAGFCLGKLIGLNNSEAVLTGVTTSGYYVRTAQSPNLPALAQLMREWPNQA